MGLATFTEEEAEKYMSYILYVHLVYLTCMSYIQHIQHMLDMFQACFIGFYVNVFFCDYWHSASQYYTII